MPRRWKKEGSPARFHEKKEKGKKRGGLTERKLLQGGGGSGIGSADGKRGGKKKRTQRHRVTNCSRKKTEIVSVSSPSKKEKKSAVGEGL